MLERNVLHIAQAEHGMSIRIGQMKRSIGLKDHAMLFGNARDFSAGKSALPAGQDVEPYHLVNSGTKIIQRQRTFTGCGHIRQVDLGFQMCRNIAHQITKVAQVELRLPARNGRPTANSV